jgi:zinc transporter, ZIP family
MLQAATYGLMVGGTLVLGALIATQTRFPRAASGVLLAVASGALMAAVAFELIGKPLVEVGPWLVGGGLFAGAAVFLAVDAWVQQHESQGAGLLAGVVLDGVPENLALGSTLGPAILVAVLLSNLPEAIGGSRDMEEDGWSRTKIVSIWSASAVLLTVTVIVGWLIADLVGDEPLAVLRAFAGGAVLASLLTEAVPQAYDQGPIWGAFAGVAGFFVSALLAT